MTGNENVEIGDILWCHSNTGLCSIGSQLTVWGVNEDSINTFPSTTSWGSRKDFRWEKFSLIKCESIPDDVLKFQQKIKEVQKSNAVYLALAKSRLSKKINIHI